MITVQCDRCGESNAHRSAHELSASVSLGDYNFFYVTDQVVCYCKACYTVKDQLIKDLEDQAEELINQDFLDNQKETTPVLSLAKKPIH